MTALTVEQPVCPDCLGEGERGVHQNYWGQWDTEVCRLCDGAGTLDEPRSWDGRHRSDLHLTFRGTIVVCVLAGLVFGLLVLTGQSVVCAMDRAAYGHGAHIFCDDFTPVVER